MCPNKIVHAKTKKQMEFKRKDTPEENISMLRRSGECAKETEEEKKKTRMIKI